MSLGNNILAQGQEVIYIDNYEIKNDILISTPKFEGVLEYDVVPISMWIEAICQNGEIYCREKIDNLGMVVLTNIQGVRYEEKIKKELKNIYYQTKIICIIKNYIKSEISVWKADAELFKCNCTHCFKVRK